MWQDSKSWHLAASNGFWFFSCPGIRRCGYASYWQKAESRKQKGAVCTFSSAIAMHHLSKNSAYGIRAKRSNLFR